MTSEPYKVGDKVWSRVLDRMSEITEVDSKRLGDAVYYNYLVEGSPTWHMSSQLAPKDVPMFREATERGLERRSRLPATTWRKAGTQPDGSYECGDGSLGMSVKEFGEAMLEGGERSKRALSNAMVEAAKGSASSLMQDMLYDPLKWIELLARYQRERVGGE